ncbi:MAG: RIO1 family regulatory kinase/ATPase [Methanobacterium sp.]
MNFILGEDFKIVKKFTSYRNEVYKIKLTSANNTSFAVMKIYSNASNCESEHKNLIKLKNNYIKVPNILGKYKNKLFLEYIEGNTINDLLQKQDMGNWIEKFGELMSNIHKIEDKKGKVLKEDCNLRNFLWNNNQIYGIDFEKTTYGDPKEDIGNICYFLLNNSPSWTDQKKIIMLRFLRAYEFYFEDEIHDINNLIKKSALKAKIRREKYRKN